MYSVRLRRLCRRSRICPSRRRDTRVAVGRGATLRNQPSADTVYTLICPNSGLNRALNLTCGGFDCNSTLDTVITNNWILILKILICLRRNDNNTRFVHRSLRTRCPTIRTYSQTIEEFRLHLGTGDRHHSRLLRYTCIHYYLRTRPSCLGPGADYLHNQRNIQTRIELTEFCFFSTFLPNDNPIAVTCHFIFVNILCYINNNSLFRKFSNTLKLWNGIAWR